MQIDCNPIVQVILVLTIAWLLYIHYRDLALLNQAIKAIDWTQGILDRAHCLYDDDAWEPDYADDDAWEPDYAFTSIERLHRKVGPSAFRSVYTRLDPDARLHWLQERLKFACLARRYAHA